MSTILDSNLWTRNSKNSTIIKTFMLPVHFERNKLYHLRSASHVPRPSDILPLLNQLFLVTYAGELQQDRIILNEILSGMKAEEAFLLFFFYVEELDLFNFSFYQKNWRKIKASRKQWRLLQILNFQLILYLIIIHLYLKYSAIGVVRVRSVFFAIFSSVKKFAFRFLPFTWDFFL